MQLMAVLFTVWVLIDTDTRTIIANSGTFLCLARKALVFLQGPMVIYVPEGAERAF